MQQIDFRDQSVLQNKLPWKNSKKNGNSIGRQLPLSRLPQLLPRIFPDAGTNIFTQLNFQCLQQSFKLKYLYTE